MTDEAFFHRILFDAYMAEAITDMEVREACYRLSIPYPPKKGNQDTLQAPVFTQKDLDHGIHCN